MTSAIFPFEIIWSEVGNALNRLTQAFPRVLHSISLMQLLPTTADNEHHIINLTAGLHFCEFQFACHCAILYSAFGPTLVHLNHYLLICDQYHWICNSVLFVFVFLNSFTNASCKYTSFIKSVFSSVHSCTSTHIVKVKAKVWKDKAPTWECSLTCHPWKPCKWYQKKA